MKRTRSFKKTWPKVTSGSCKPKTRTSGWKGRDWRREQRKQKWAERQPQLLWYKCCSLDISSLYLKHVKHANSILFDLPGVTPLHSINNKSGKTVGNYWNDFLPHGSSRSKQAHSLPLVLRGDDGGSFFRLRHKMVFFSYLISGSLAHFWSKGITETPDITLHQAFSDSSVFFVSNKKNPEMWNILIFVSRLIR